MPSTDSVVRGQYSEVKEHQISRHLMNGGIKVKIFHLCNFVDKNFAIIKDKDYIDNPEKQTKVKEYENQINQMVYKLYGLTPKETKIVEGDK